MTNTDQPETSKEAGVNSTTKSPLYPEVSGWLKSLIFWLGLAFVVIAFFMQNVSGYF